MAKQTEPNGLAGKLHRLCEINYRKHGSLPTVKKGDPDWHTWRSWRQRHGLSVSFMETGDYSSWTVPTELPPESVEVLDAMIGGAAKETW